MINKQKKVSTPSSRLKEALSLRNMKQIELSEKTGISKPRISCYISGKYEPKQEALYQLGKALNVAEMWLAGYDIPYERKWDDLQIDAISEMQADVTSDIDSSEKALQSVMLEIAEMGFDSEEIETIRKYAHAVKEVDSISNELHMAFIELFRQLYELELSINDLKEIYTFAQFIKSKNH